MYEFASAPLRVAPRHESVAAASPLLDLGEGMHVLASEIIAIQALPEARDFRRHFRKMGDPCATVMLRGGQVLDAFREIDDLRAEWERSLRADWGTSPRALAPVERVA